MQWRFLSAVPWWIWVILWAVLNAADAVWLYFYVRTSVYPIPHNATNRSTSAFEGFKVMMFVFGFVWGIVNIFAVCAVWGILRERKKRCGKRNRSLISAFELFIIPPLLLILAVLPFFGGWIVKPAVQITVWNHGCDSFPMVVVLDVKAFTDPTTIPNVAHFYSNSPSPAHPTALFTYEFTTSDNDDLGLFSLRSWDAPQSSIPLALYPTLQAVQYVFTNDSLSGNCTLPQSAAANASTSVVPCMSGTFDPGAHLHFNITSAVPLNTTLASAYSAGVAPATAALGIAEKEWDVSGYAPAVKLQQADADGQLGAPVLKTTVTKPTDVTQMKVCVAGVQGRANGLVAPEVLAPLGLIVMSLALEAVLETPATNNSVAN